MKERKERIRLTERKVYDAGLRPGKKDGMGSYSRSRGSWTYSCQVVTLAWYFILTKVLFEYSSPFGSRCFENWWFFDISVVPRELTRKLIYRNTSDLTLPTNRVKVVMQLVVKAQWRNSNSFSFIVCLDQDQQHEWISDSQKSWKHF